MAVNSPPAVKYACGDKQRGRGTCDCELSENLSVQATTAQRQRSTHRQEHVRALNKTREDFNPHQHAVAKRAQRTMVVIAILHPTV
jgi:hypothetical protein